LLICLEKKISRFQKAWGKKYLPIYLFFLVGKGTQYTQTERQKISRDLFSFLRLWKCPLSTKSEDYMSAWGCTWRKIISLRKLVSDVRPIDILTGEIAVEVTGIVGVSPFLWYFRYIASIFFTLHKRLWLKLVTNKAKCLKRKTINKSMYFKRFLATNNKYISVIAHSTHWIDIWAYRKYLWNPLPSPPHLHNTKLTFDTLLWT
jgi:hypothetical protein